MTQKEKDCAKCENPVDGHYYRHYALLRKKLKEVWFKICNEQNSFQDFLNTFESSSDNSNVVNAPQEPIVFNQDPGEKSSQSPPQINHQCCYGCGDPLDGIFCRRCTCESCGNGAHIGYNCSPKVLVTSNPEPCHNQNVDELPQTLESFHLTCYSGDKNSFSLDSTPDFVNDFPNVFYPQSSKNAYEFCRNDAYYSHDCPPQFLVIHQPPQDTSVEILYDHENVINYLQTFSRKFNRFSVLETPKVLLLAWDRVSEIKNVFGNKQYKPEDMQELFRKLFNDLQNIHEELAEYINIPSWNCPAFSSHDYDEDYTIAIKPEEPDNSLNQFEEFSDSNDDSTSIDDDYFFIDNINYVEASPLDSELVSLEEVEDDNLREKLLNINLLIAKIKSLNDNPTPDHVLKPLSPFPIPVEDSDSFLEKSDTSLSYSENSLPEFEPFSNHMEETNSGSTTTHADYSLPNKPDPCKLTSIVDSEIRENVLSATNVNLPPEEDHSPLFSYVVWIFLFFLTYLVVPLNLLSFGNEDSIFDPGISNYHFPSLLSDVSHRCETFM
uniref:Uncharacterized protein n=1 Tax=Tanacetum cinerariifolium TaxID=118510 RepID=A0A6L2MSE5_TANCI|nr:hypothetical protein [Tanacetum cinerariifolium]